MDPALSTAVSLPPLDYLLTLVFYLLFGFFALFTAILYYHWTTFAADKVVSRITLVSYMLCTLPLLLLMGAIVLNI